MVRRYRRVNSLSMHVFRTDIPDEPEITSDIIIGGMAVETDSIALADSYLLAATRLIDSWEGHNEPWMLSYPTFYICRHALELYLKAALPQHEKPNHKLHTLIDEFRSLLVKRLNTDIPASLRNDLYALAKLDPDGQNFRYSTDTKGRPIILPGEYWISLQDLRQFLETMSSGIKKAVFRLNSPGGHPTMHHQGNKS